MPLSPSIPMGLKATGLSLSQTQKLVAAWGRPGNWKSRISTQSSTSAWLISILLKHLRTAHTWAKVLARLTGTVWVLRLSDPLHCPSSPLQPPEQQCPRVQRVRSWSAQGQALTHFTLLLNIFITAAFIASSHSYILAEEGRELERSCDRN